ncbi:MAG TPA: hypothetical protein VKA68_13935 [bacterium]|nr:hypothetical protein [bacterium]
MKKSALFRLFSPTNLTNERSCLLVASEVPIADKQRLQALPWVLLLLQ